MVANHQGGEHQGRISRHEAPGRSRTDLDKICYSVIPCFAGYYRRVMRLRNRRSSVYFFANKSSAFKKSRCGNGGLLLLRYCPKDGLVPICVISEPFPAIGLRCKTLERIGVTAIGDLIQLPRPKYPPLPRRVAPSAFRGRSWSPARFDARSRNSVPLLRE